MLTILRLMFLIAWALSFPVWVYFLLSFDYWSDYLRTTFLDENLDGQLFDFVIVGSGSAGAVVASRLSKHNRVLLLEAGGEPIPFTNIPGLAMNLLGYSPMDYTYKTEPQDDLYLGMANNQSTWNRGKVLGGSSTINYMFYLRGNPLDYDNWAAITGDDEWKYENVLPFFKKSIREYRGKFQDDKVNYGNSDYGFLTIERRKWRPLSQTLIDASKEFGLDEVDANGGQRAGVADVEVTQRDGERASTYKAILQELMKSRKNLHVSKYSQAVKVKLSKRGNQAEGVWYYQHGRLKFARVKKEVVVSGGTIDSPKLLMLSGIGPQNHLESIGVKPRINLPVGQNLQDHCGTSIFPFVIDEPQSFVLERDFGPEIFHEYFSASEGPLTVPSGVTTQVFLSSSLATKTHNQSWPDIQSFFIPAGTSTALQKMLVEGFGFREKFLAAGMNPHEGNDGFMHFLIPSRPKSKGEITLRDKSPFSSPVIRPNYFTHPDDMKILLEGIKFLVKLSEEAKSFKDLNTRFTTVPALGCEGHTYRSDAYWECYVRHNTLTMWHPVGTCRAGKESDPKSVVDSKLRVLKTKGLRVIDASIMPVIVNANTNAPTMMIGEKGSYFIQEHWAKQYLVCDRLERFLSLDHRKCYFSQFP